VAPDAKVIVHSWNPIAGDFMMAKLNDINRCHQIDFQEDLINVFRQPFGCEMNSLDALYERFTDEDSDK
jgi:hypothetical protein